MLFELGAYRLLGNDPERTWRFSRVWVPWFLDWMTENVAYGMARIPAEGGVVLAINHLSAIDPPAVGIHSLRTIRYMTKVELLQTPIVGVFAEGTRRPFGYPDATQPGAALLAMQEGVPLVPIGLDSFGWSLRNRRPTAVVCGEPLDLSPFPRNGAGYKEATGVIEAELIRLWKLAVHAVEDGMPERLRDGTERDAPLRRRDLLYPPTGPPWPTEPWAEGPLGPVYKAIT